MKQNFDLCLAMLLGHEDGFIGYHDDHDGLSNFVVNERLYRNKSAKGAVTNLGCRLGDAVGTFWGH